VTFNERLERVIAGCADARGLPADDHAIQTSRMMLEHTYTRPELRRLVTDAERKLNA
jgi:hypothetical protein